MKTPLLSLTTLLASIALLLSGCVSASLAPPGLAPASCELDGRLPGKWKSSRGSQVGPASMTFILNCDCTYESRVRLLFMSVREEGSYWVRDGVMLFSRASGEITEWPFDFDDGQLILQESPNEFQAYERRAERECS